MYLDRIYESDKYSGLENNTLKSVPQLVCPSCKTLIGIPYIYEKENRLALRLFVGGVVKKSLNPDKISSSFFHQVELK